MEIERLVTSPQRPTALPRNDTVTVFPAQSRIIVTDAEFQALRPAWDELFDHSADASPFCSWSWSHVWWRHYKPRLALGKMQLHVYIVCIYDHAEQLIGLAPHYAAVPIDAPLRLSSLRPIGSRLAGTQEDLTEEPVLLFRDGYEDVALQELVTRLSEPPLEQHDYFVFRRYERASEPSLAHQCAIIARRCVSLKREVQPGQTVVLADTWDHYLGGLSKSMRDNIKYYPRLLTRRGHAWAMETITQPDAVREAARMLVALHRQRSDSKRGIAHTNHLPTDLQAEFLIDVLQQLAAQGMVALYCLRIDGATVAVLAVLRHKQTITIYYSGFDPAWYDYSPITILTTEAIRRAIADGDTTANFLPGSFPWKDRWGAISDRTLVQETFLLRHPRSLIRAVVDLGRRALLPPEPTPR